MDSKFLFSVIVPIYNVEKYLPECLDSLLNQDYKDEFEVILLNDGSTDGSLEIINNYKNRFSNCVVVSRENKGLLFTRVEGVKIAKGQYIVFVDSDDYLAKDALSIYYEQIKNDDYDIIRGNYSKFTNEMIEDVMDYNKEYIITQENFIKDYYEVLLKSIIFNNVWRQAIKKDIISIDEINYTIAMGEDIEFNQACYKNTHKIKIIKKILYYYRKTENSLTNTFSLKRIQKNIIDIGKVYDTILKNIKMYNDMNLIKLGYSAYLKMTNYYCYMLINNSNDNKKIIEILDLIIKDNKTIEAKKILKYKDIPFRKTRLLLYMLMKGNKKAYIFTLKTLSKLGVKYNH